jgi:thioredoxin reductase (NADPH)
MFDLVIVGAGPAGIAVAVEAIRSGTSASKIILIEKGPEHSWSIRKFYPESKLVAANYKGQNALCEGALCLPDSSKMETLNYLDKVIEDYNLKINYNEEIYGMEKVPSGDFIIKGTKDTYYSKTCAIAIGILGRPNPPSYKIPPELKGKVTFDITSVPIKDKNVLVVGGGDSASEYCQYLLEGNNSVTLSYRQPTFSRMNELNQENLLKLQNENKVKILFNSNVLKLEDLDGPQVIFSEPELGSLKFDHVVLALGGSTPKNFLKLLGIQFNNEEPIIKHGYETSVEGLFLVGDLVFGKSGGSIISAFNSAHRAVKLINSKYFSAPKSNI